MTKTLNQIIFFFLHQNQNICLEKKHNFKLNGRTLRGYGVNVTFNNINSVILCGSDLIRRKLEYPEKTIDLPQVTDKLYHVMLYRIVLRNTLFPTCVGFGERRRGVD
jgi:hypothetical protein